MKDVKRILKNWRIILLIFLVTISLLLICNIIPVNKERLGRPLGIGFGNGLDYGLDFVGGVQIQLRLNVVGNQSLNKDLLEVEKGILERRLNAMGLRDIEVRPWGNDYILVEVAEASPDEITTIENILKQQANFEARIDGDLAILGSDVSIDLRPQGSYVTNTQPSQWGVSIKLSPEGGEMFCRAGRNKMGKPIDMFLDRPVNTIIVMANSTYKLLGEMHIDETDLTSDVYTRLIENRSLIPIVVVDNNTINLSQILNLYNKGFTNVIIAGDDDKVPNSILNQLAENNMTVERIQQGNKTYGEWIKDIIGLQSSPRLNCDPCSSCKYDAQITGSAPTLDLAREDMMRTRILLSSGNLPAKAVVESKSEIPPSLGERFLMYSFIIGIIAIITVAIVIFLRYKRPFIVLPIIITGLSEIIIILGFASLINWELDLPAVAGIIAAVGTGVDDQIVITDETMRRGRKEKKVISITEQIKRAFFVIFTAAATTTAVMIPILSIQALKGFAFTTIVGVLIGVFITRQAYAKIIEEILKE